MKEGKRGCWSEASVERLSDVEKVCFPFSFLVWK